MKWQIIRLIAVIFVAFHMQFLNLLQELPKAFASTNADVSIYVTPLSGVGTPSGLTLTDLGLTTVQANWSTGANATYTMLRASRHSIPASITDGELIYYDTGTSYNITEGVLLLINYQDIHVSAWSYGADNTTASNSYISASIGGETMTEVADAITEGLGGLTSLTSSIGTIGVALGIFGYLLPVILLSILAFWKENAILFMITFGISWMIGLYAPNIISGNSQTTVLGLTLGLMMGGYGVFCAVMAFRLMFWKSEE